MKPMKTGRPVLRFFSESDLTPLDPPNGVRGQVTHLLDQDGLADVREFACAFGRDGEVTISRQSLDDRGHLRLFIAFCQMLGAVSVRIEGATIAIRTSGRLGRHVPEILHIYLEDSFSLIDNWNSVHVIPENNVSALELVQQMELRRILQERQSGRSPTPMAERPVGFALFHAMNEKGESCYLFEVNKDWRRLNFIGGKQEPQDRGDFAETTRREISEELGIAQSRLSLTRLNDQPILGYSLSGNVGSLARYPCVLFGVRVDGELKVRMLDRWLTESAIRRCVNLADSPIMVNPAYLSYLLDGRPCRLSTLPLSTSARVRSTPWQEITADGEPVTQRWWRVIRENKDLVAAVLTIVAATMSVIAIF
jgi:8-oxo-dGTP pyrophosphatase MutT (NUDIX family)